MNASELKDRTKQFHITVLKLCEGLPKTTTGFELAKQIIRSAGSVGANYRAACRAKSDADFIYKLKVVLEEADETLYWLEIIMEIKLVEEETAQALIKEANELISIFVASIKTIKTRIDRQS